MTEIIDTHTHVIASDPVKYPLAPLGGHQSTWSQERPVDYRGLIAAMDSAGVAKSVVVQASTVYGHDNSYAAAAVKAHPDRFIGVFSADVMAPDAVDQIKRWMDAGMAGIRLFTTGTTMPGQATWLNSEQSYPAWAYCEANKIPVCLQMTQDGIPMLVSLLERFSKVKVLLDHLARPKLEDGPPYALAKPLFDLVKYPGVFLKLTTRTITMANVGKSTAVAFLPFAVKAFGADRIAWGSNFPAAEEALPELLAEALRGIETMSQADRDLILGGTAKRLYPSLAAAR
jgi:predicted TIM-barrel fold metal-dependent hydrolase